MYLVARVPLCYTLPREVVVYELLSVGSSYINPAHVAKKEAGEVIDLGEVEPKIFEKHQELCVRLGLGGNTYIRLADLTPEPVGRMSRDWRIKRAIADKNTYPKKMCDQALENAESLKENILSALRLASRPKLTLIRNEALISRSTSLMVLGSP